MRTHEGLRPFYDVFGTAIHVEVPGRAKLDRPFAFLTSEKLPWAYAGEPPVLSSQGNLTVLTLRGKWDGSDLPSEFFGLDEPGIIRHYSTNRALEVLKERMNRLYGAYLRTGRVGESEIAVCQKQDDERTERTTHFIGGTEWEFFSHLQFIWSRSTKDPLNLEDHLGPLPRKDGELWAELGRLNIEDLEALEHRQSKLLDAKDTKTLLRLQIWQRAFSMLTWDVGPDRLAMQANQKVLTLLRHQKLLVFDSRPADGHPDEFILTMTKAQMKTSEENLEREKLIWMFRSQLERAKDLDPKAPGTTFTLEPLLNERDVLRRLGIVKVNWDQGPIEQFSASNWHRKAASTRRSTAPFFVADDYDYYATNSFSFTVTRKRAEQILRYLESQRPQ